ncbi:MAG: GIY-YIG nuclease family protein [Bacteroidetes bacterium]|nr:GIY-YIG nuclease family protein [Bacteroidota bacterium]
MYFTYVLYSESADRIYVGYSHDPEKRLWYHNEGLAFATKPYRPWILIYSKPFAERSQAMRHEKELKTHSGRTWIRDHLLKDGVRQRPD